MFTFCGEITESVEERRAVDVSDLVLGKTFDMTFLSLLLFKFGRYSPDECIARSVKNCLNHQALSVATNGSIVCLITDYKQFFRSFSWDSSFLTSFFKDLEERTEFADDTKL